jgi:hypothetical protein
MRRFRFFLTIALFAPLVFSQTPTGQIKGRIVDNAQAVVPGAEVAAINTATNVTTRVESNTSGNYELPNLIPGVYRIEVRKAGFKQYIREPIEVRVGDVLTIDAPLQLGEVTESVTVKSESPLLQTATAGLDQVVDSRRIENLPSPGNSVIYLLQTAPAVTVSTAPTNLWPPDAVGSASGTTVAGTVSTSQYALDGIPMMSRNGQFTVNPQPEMVKEFAVQVAAYDASLGRFTGAYVNMVTKSGANDLHGSFIYSNLSRGLIAHDLFTNNFINNPATGPITSDKIDQAWPSQRDIRYRGTIGGPLVLPKLYNGRNRTFWIFGGDGVIRQRASRASYTIPTVAERDGDFSQLLKVGSQYQIYDPATIQPTANGRFSRQPFPNNIIPASRLSPAAKQILSYYPPPNQPGNADGTNNYSDPNLADSPYVGFLGRVDHSVSDNQRLFFSFNNTSATPLSNNYFHNPATGTLGPHGNTGFSLDDTLMLTPTWVLELRYGLDRYETASYPPSLGFDLSTLGLPSSLLSQLDSSLTTLPSMSITGLTALGGNSGTSVNTTYHSFSAQASHLLGDHAFRFGAEYRLFLNGEYSYGNVSPAYTFGTTWTAGPLDNSAAAPIGQGLASLLLGLPTTGSINRNASIAQKSGYWGVFFQDDWKVARKLTLNLGLRYEYETALTERYNRSTRGFDFTTANPIQSLARQNLAQNPVPGISAASFQTPGGLVFAGVNGQPRALFNSQPTNFLPRIGLAYQVLPRTVLRAGYGIYYEAFGADTVDAIQQGFSATTTLVPSLDNGMNFQANLQNPFPNGLLQPAGSANGLRTYLGQTLNVLSPDLRIPYVQRWSANIQHELPHRVLLDIGYLGNRATHLGATRNFNAIPAQYLSQLNRRDPSVINYLSQAVSNPFSGISDFSGTSLQTKTVPRSQLLRPYPEFGDITATTDDGYSWYHALIVRVEKRFSNGFTAQGSYTYSKAMQATEYLNASDPLTSHVVSPYDRTHSLAVSAVEELPFGQGKRWLNSNRWVNLAVGGWSLNGIFQLASGFPLSWGNVVFNGDIKDIALPASERTAAEWFNVNAGFDHNAANQLVNNIRTFPLRLNGVRQAPINIVNLSVMKDFRFRERIGLQFRAEAVDLLNHPIYAAPDMSPTSGTFGQVTTLGAGNTQRRISLGGRLSW